MNPYRGIGWKICYVVALILVLATRPYYWFKSRH